MKAKILVIVFLILFAFLCVFFAESYYNYTYPLKYREDIVREAELNNLNPALVASIINAESHFEATVVSSKGAKGLMQIMPQTAQFVAKELGMEYSEDMLLEPSINIKIGCYYLNYLSEKFSSVETMLCAYNAGEGIVRSWLKDESYSIDGVSLVKIPYTQTNTYVDKILRILPVYEKMFK